MTPIELYLQSEKEKTGWWDRLVKNYPTVTPTEVLLFSQAKLDLEPAKVLKPALLTRIVPFFILFVGCVFWVSSLKQLIFPQQGPSTYSTIFVFVFSNVYVLVALYYAFFKREQFFRLTVNREGLSVNKRFTSWLEIDGTYVWKKKKGRYDMRKLLIEKKDGTVEALDLTYFMISDNRLAAIVEQYKNTKT